MLGTTYSAFSFYIPSDPTGGTTFFFFETFLFILDYNLRPRSVLPPGPVKNLYSVYMGIPLHSVFNIL